MYSDIFCKVYNEFGWNYYPEAFGQQLLQWMAVQDFHPQTSMDLACGTGSGSVASTLWMLGQLPGGRLTVRNRGGTLTVTVGGTKDEITSIHLQGPTEVVKIYEI